MLSRNVKSLRESLVGLQAGKLARHFLDAGKGSEALGSETEEFVPHGNSNSQRVSVCDSYMSPSVHRVRWSSPGDART